MIPMPGKSYQGPLPPLTDAQIGLRDELRRDVEAIAVRRNLHDAYDNLLAAARYIEEAWERAGYTVRRLGYQALGRKCDNLEVEIAGGGDEVVVLGAHYDAVIGSPGANDNATGVAALLALARRFAGSSRRPARTLRFVAFVNEEPPHFQTADMGSRIYARRCRERGDRIAAMLSLETIGCYSDEPGSQKYPPPLGLVYPSTGNFIGFVGNLASGGLVRRVVGAFRERAKFPSEGAALPAWLPGVGWSDHWSFWQEGYPAVMVTDTAPFRYAHYHTEEDTADKVDFERLTRVVEGLVWVVETLADANKKGQLIC